MVLIPGLLKSGSVADAPLFSRLISLAERIPSVAGAAGSENSQLPVFSNVDSRHCGLESLVMHSVFKHTHDSCAARFTYQQDFPDATENPVVLRADPAYQQIDMNNATLSDPALLDLNIEQAQALVSTLNDFFKEDGLRFEQTDPQRWYCHFDVYPDVQTLTPGVAVDRDVSDCRPTGADAVTWRKHLAEIEMLLFEHPVNSHRESLGQLPVNTLWLWGEGRCDESPVPNIDLAGDNFYSRSVAEYVGLEYLSIDQLNADHALVCTIDALEKNSVAGEASFNAALNALESSLGAHLWQNLKPDAYPIILIWCGGSGAFLVNSSVRKKFWLKAWRKPYALSAHLQNTQPAMP